MKKDTIEERQKVQKEQLLKQLHSIPIVQVACEKTGLGRATYYRWRKEDKEFQELADKALHEGRKLMNDMAESQLLSAIRDKNLTAIIFWLKHHHNSYKTKVEISGTLDHRNEILSPEQETLVMKALKLANLPQLTNPTEHE